MKFTLLQLTQNILSALNSDEVNSIGDTPEAMQVATCIQTSYLNMQGRYDLPEHNQLFQLNPSLSAAQPVLMFRPAGVNRIEHIKYFDSNPLDGAGVDDLDSHAVNLDIHLPWSTTSTTSNIISTGSKTFTVAAGLNILPGDPAYAVSGVNQMIGSVSSYSGTTLILLITSIVGAGTYSTWTISQVSPLSNFGPGYLDVKILGVKEFLDMVNSFNPGESDVGSFTLTVNQSSTLAPGAFTFYYKNNKQPQYCCIISNYYVIFDSYDNTQDSTLQSSKNLCYGWVVPQFVIEDSFIPDLDEAQVPLLLNEAKSLAWIELKNSPHQKAEQEVLRQLSSLQKFKALAHQPTPFDRLPYYGRL